jgi:hypothetical protein
MRPEGVTLHGRRRGGASASVIGSRAGDADSPVNLPPGVTRPWNQAAVSSQRVPCLEVVHPRVPQRVLRRYRRELSLGSLGASGMQSSPRLTVRSALSCHRERRLNPICSIMTIRTVTIADTGRTRLALLLNAKAAKAPVRTGLGMHAPGPQHNLTRCDDARRFAVYGHSASRAWSILLPRAHALDARPRCRPLPPRRPASGSSSVPAHIRDHDFGGPV